MLHRVLVLMGSPVSLLLTGLLQLLLCLGVGKAETELDAINLVGDIVKVVDHLLGNVAILETERVSHN